MTRYASTAARPVARSNWLRSPAASDPTAVVADRGLERGDVLGQGARGVDADERGRVRHHVADEHVEGRVHLIRDEVRGRGHEADDGALAALSTREAEVLKALMDGKSADEMPAEQFVSITTVRTHIRSILRKLGVRSQLAAVALAHRARWSVPAERPRIFYVM